jgi:type II secretory pathway pseudopilin PulG
MLVGKQGVAPPAKDPHVHPDPQNNSLRGTLIPVDAEHPRQIVFGTPMKRTLVTAKVDETTIPIFPALTSWQYAALIIVACLGALLVIRLRRRLQVKERETKKIETHQTADSAGIQELKETLQVISASLQRIESLALAWSNDHKTGKGDGKTTEDDRADHSQPPGRTVPARRPGSKETAKELFLMLLQNLTIDPAPSYASPEADNDPLSPFMTRDVFLRTSHNPFAVFLLFPGQDETSGWVLPNPAVIFRPELLRAVYPDMTEETYARKESFVPVAVQSAGNRRWRVLNITSVE